VRIKETSCGSQDNTYLFKKSRYEIKS